MLDTVAGGQGTSLITAIAVVSVALIALAAVFWIMRARASSTFIRGGRNRQPRLAVLDAAAVDTRRRLVLVRRDDVEHLIMIGGPTDVVIESRIVPAERAPVGNAAASVLQTVANPKPDIPQPAPAALREKRPEPRHPLPDPEPPVRAPAPAPAAERPRLIAGAAASLGAVAGGLAATAAQSMQSVKTSVTPSQPLPTQPAPDAVPVTASIAVPDSPEEPMPDVSEAARNEAAGLFDVVRSRVFAPAETSEAPMDEVADIDHLGNDQLDGLPVEDPWSVDSAGDAIPDFETVLADELSGDLDLEADDLPSYSDPANASEAYAEALDAALAEELEIGMDEAAPPLAASSGASTQPTPKDRDSLEAEMERLLGDLTRR